MAGKIQELNESVVIRGLRRFRDRYFPNSGKAVKDYLTPDDTGKEEPEPGSLDSLPVNIHFYLHLKIYWSHRII